MPPKTTTISTFGVPGTKRLSWIFSSLQLVHPRIMLGVGEPAKVLWEIAVFSANSRAKRGCFKYNYGACNPARTASTVANIAAPFLVAVIRIRRSDVANFWPAKENPSVPILKHPITPLNLAAFRFYLSDHPNKQFGSTILHIISHSAIVGYFGPQSSRFTPNSLSSKDRVDALSKQIQRKSSYNILLYHLNPSHFSPLGASKSVLQ